MKVRLTKSQLFSEYQLALWFFIGPEDNPLKVKPDGTLGTGGAIRPCWT